MNNKHYDVAFHYKNQKQRNVKKEEQKNHSLKGRINLIVTYFTITSLIDL